MPELGVDIVVDTRVTAFGGTSVSLECIHTGAPRAVDAWWLDRAASASADDASSASAIEIPFTESG